MARKIDLFNMHLAAYKKVKEQIVPPKKSEDSDYFYLTKLGQDDVCFDYEYVKIMKVTVTYTVKGYYASVNYSGDGSQAITFSSVLNIDPSQGYVVSKSKSFEKMPKEYLSHVEKYSLRNSLTTKDIEKLVIGDAKAKTVKNYSNDADPFSKMEIIESKTKKSTICSVEWARITAFPGGEYLGFGYAYEGDEPVYHFEPKKYTEALKKLEPKPELKKEAPATEKKSDNNPLPKTSTKLKKTKKAKKSGSKISHLNILYCFVLGIIVAAVILLVEFAGILIVNKGNIAKTDPGAYAITTENYDKFITFTADKINSVERLKEKTNYESLLWRSDSSSMQDYPLFRAIPRNSAFNIFDAREKKSLESVGDYHPLKWFVNYIVPKYVISDLYVKCKVTYSYNGEEHTAISEVYIDKIDSYYTNCFITADFPEESMISETRTYVTDMKGNTTKKTVFKADIDYWSVEILEVSGLAEVKEVENDESK